MCFVKPIELDARAITIRQFPDEFQEITKNIVRVTTTRAEGATQCPPAKLLQKAAQVESPSRISRRRLRPPNSFPIIGPRKPYCFDPPNASLIGFSAGMLSMPF